MKNKVNYIQVINLINLFHARRDKSNSETEAESRKMGRNSFGYDLVTDFHLY